MLAIAMLCFFLFLIGTFYQGKNSTVTWSSTSQPTDKCDLDFKHEIIDTTNMLSAGQQSNLAGVGSADASLGGPYNGSMGILSGDSQDFIFATGGGGPSFTLPMRVSNIRLGTAVRNQVWQQTTQLTSNGVFTVTI